MPDHKKLLELNRLAADILAEGQGTGKPGAKATTKQIKEMDRALNRRAVEMAMGGPGPGAKATTKQIKEMDRAMNRLSDFMQKWDSGDMQFSAFADFLQDLLEIGGLSPQTLDLIDRFEMEFTNMHLQEYRMTPKKIKERMKRLMEMLSKDWSKGIFPEF